MTFSCLLPSGVMTKQGFFEYMIEKPGVLGGRISDPFKVEVITRTTRKLTINAGAGDHIEFTLTGEDLALFSRAPDDFRMAMAADDFNISCSPGSVERVINAVLFPEHVQWQEVNRDG